MLIRIVLLSLVDELLIATWLGLVHYRDRSIRAILNKEKEHGSPVCDPVWGPSDVERAEVCHAD